jgi:CheY-specific phosphatase CheX
MKACKRVLFLTQPESALSALAPAIVPYNFEAHLCTSVDQTLTFIKNEPTLSLVVVDGAMDAAPSTVRAIRQLAGALPVAWLLGEGQDEPDFGLLAPNTTFDCLPSADQFAQKADKLVSADYYPKSLLMTLVSAANSVMAATFQASVDVGQAWLKHSSLLPGEFNAFIPFLGLNSAGHVMVSGQRGHLLKLGQELGFEEEEETRSVVKEVLGEIANQIVGRVKRECGAYLPDLRVGLPMIASGIDIAITYPSAKPAVSVQVLDEGGQLHVEFSFHRADVAADHSELQDAGDVVLF